VKDILAGESMLEEPKRNTGALNAMSKHEVRPGAMGQNNVWLKLLNKALRGRSSPPYSPRLAKASAFNDPGRALCCL
jgi:hypothetical protein